MLIDVVHRNRPPSDLMTQVALRTVLPPMNVRMAILALLACVREYRIHMTFLARNFRVHATQRKRCLAMIKLQVIAQWQPSLAGVAVLTSHLYRPMRIFVGRNDGGCSSSGVRHARRDQHRHQEPVSILVLDSPGQNHSLRVIWLKRPAKTAPRAEIPSIAFIADRGDRGRLLRGGSSLSGFVGRIVFSLTGTQQSFPTVEHRWIDRSSCHNAVCIGRHRHRIRQL